MDNWLTLCDLRRMVKVLLTLALAFPAAVVAQGDAEACLHRARAAYATGALEPALAHADSALAMRKDLAAAYKLRGDIKQRQANPHGAMLDYAKAEKHDPSDPRLYISRSALHITEGRTREALTDLERAIKLDPTDADAWYNRACALYLEENNEAALRDLHKALQLNKEDPNALLLRGVIKGELSRDSDGLADVEEALRLKPDIANGAMSHAVLLHGAGRYEEAIAKFTEVIESERDLAEAYYFRADCQYNLGDKAGACVDYRRSAELGDKESVFIVRNYCNTDETKIPKRAVRKRKTTIEF
jgi:tetratricopeptide (TPR) repeat protein